MSVLAEMANRYFYEVEEGDAPEEVATPEEEVDGKAEEASGGAEAMVDAIVEATPGMEKTVHSMLKYAANTDDEENVFDEALLYYEDVIMAGETEAAPEEDVAEEEIPEEK